ncbi:unnamed protein product [Soboliphyme baturini]|uniref:KxDL domain-containing protein n=1 Tax=Soboliphyme baturini TaxID=241478 RepID=A0A183J060_9BILA|nr:unnamed protein product [Soboliphyme baturini]
MVAFGCVAFLKHARNQFLKLPTKEGDVQTGAAMSVNDPSNGVISSLVGLTSDADIAEITEVQKETLSRLEKSNEMLINCMALTSSSFDSARKQVDYYADMIAEMKRDLDEIFHRIRKYKRAYVSNVSTEEGIYCNCVLMPVLRNNYFNEQSYLIK